MKNFYTVKVSNVGNVYAGFNGKRATEAFNVYRIMSKIGAVNRLGGEDVYLFMNKRLIREYQPETIAV